MKATIKMQARGVLTLPKKLRTRMNFGAGSIVQAQERDGGIFISPVSHLDPDLQEALRSALDDLRKGNTIGPFSSMKEYKQYRKSKRSRAK